MLSSMWDLNSLLLLLLSHFSCVRLCATPQTAAHQAPPSLGFSRQERWSGLPFPSPMHASEKWKWSRSFVSDSTRLLAHPMDCSLPGSSVHGILQARALEVGCHCLLRSIALDMFNEKRGIVQVTSHYFYFLQRNKTLILNVCNVLHWHCTK